VGSRAFELAEVKLLIDAIQSSKFISKSKSDELIKKMNTFVSEHQAKQLKRQVYVNDRIKTMNESIYYSVDSIHNALMNNKQIEFLYCAWTLDKKLEPKKEGKKYRVSPWALTWADESPLMKQGYSVSKKANLSDKERHRILARILDERIMTKSRMLYYLDEFINTRKGKPMYKNAIEKWTQDRNYVRNYKI